MSSFTIYLSPIEPSVLEIGELTSNSIDTTDEPLSIKLLPTSSPNSNTEIELFLRKLSDNYIYAVFDPGSSYISWERSSHQVITGYDDLGNPEYRDSPEASITITFKQPGNDRRAEPYFESTIVGARNPDKISEHTPFIVKVELDKTIVLGEIPENSSDIWNKTLEIEKTFKESQPIVRPGEYITVKWYMKVNSKWFYTPAMQCMYETPLFTGGWITAVTGEGVDVKYTVEVFGKEITDIVPTDFYDYQVGKWVYLMKDSNLTLDPEQDNKQMFDSSNVSDPTSNYRIVPFNFKGPMNSECAIPWEDAINLDSSINFEEVFDMITYEGTISNIDYDNDTATITIG